MEMRRWAYVELIKSVDKLKMTTLSVMFNMYFSVVDWLLQIQSSDIQTVEGE